MSCTTMRWLDGSTLRPHEADEKTYPNAWHGAMLVWLTVGARYGVPFLPHAPGSVWSLARHPDAPEATPASPRVAYSDRIVLALTFDRVWAAARNFVRLAEQIEAADLPRHCHLRAMAAELRAHAGAPHLGGACWQHQSVVDDTWYDADRGVYRTPDELGATELFDLVTEQYLP